MTEGRILVDEPFVQVRASKYSEDMPPLPAKQKKAADTLVVLTSKDEGHMLADGGSGNWKLAAHRVGQIGYVVCCANVVPKGSAHLTGHRRGFLVGKVVGAAMRGERYLLVFSHVAEINIPELWDGRSPAVYTTLEALGIDAAGLDWREWTGAYAYGASMSDPAPEAANDLRTAMRFVDFEVVRARADLAHALGVSTGRIRITIDPPQT